MDFSKLWKHIGEGMKISKGEVRPVDAEAKAGGVSENIQEKSSTMNQNYIGLVNEMDKMHFLQEAIKTKSQYKNITRKGDHVEGEMTFGSGGSWINFSASFKLMVIRLAFQDGPDAVALEIWDAQDGMAGMDPEEVEWDWSAIRDSSNEAINQMYKIAQKYVDVADLSAKLKAASVKESKVNEQNVDCDMCKTNMSPNNKGCFKYAIDSKGKWHERLPYGSEGGDVSMPCHDCNVKAWGYHHEGCDSEDCPKCGGQFAFCDCDWVSLGNKALKAPKTEAVVVERKVLNEDDAGYMQSSNDNEIKVGKLAGLNPNGMKDGIWFEDFMSAWFVELGEKEIIFGWVNGPLGYDVHKMEQDEKGVWQDTGIVEDSGEIPEGESATPEQQAEFIRATLAKYGKELPPVQKTEPKVEEKKVNETENVEEFEFETEDGQKYTAEVSVYFTRGEYGADADGRRGEMRNFIDDSSYKIWDANGKEVLEPTAEMLEIVEEYMKNMDLHEEEPEYEPDMDESKKKIKESKSLEDWRESIENEVDYVDVKPYSHNIISIALRAIAKEFGNDEANKAIKDFGLKAKGWSPVKEGEVSTGLKQWRKKQSKGAIMKPSTFKKIEQKAKASGATDPKKVAGAAYWKTAKAKYNESRVNEKNWKYVLDFNFMNAFQDKDDQLTDQDAIDAAGKARLEIVKLLKTKGFGINAPELVGYLEDIKERFEYCDTLDEFNDILRELYDTADGYDIWVDQMFGEKTGVSTRGHGKNESHSMDAMIDELNKVSLGEDFTNKFEQTAEKLADMIQKWEAKLDAAKTPEEKDTAEKRIKYLETRLRQLNRKPNEEMADWIKRANLEEAVPFFKKCPACNREVEEDEATCKNCGAGQIKDSVKESSNVTTKNGVKIGWEKGVGYFWGTSEGGKPKVTTDKNKIAQIKKALKESKVNEDDIEDEPIDNADGEQPAKPEEPKVAPEATKQEEPEENKEPSKDANVEDVKEYLGNDGDDMYYSLLSSGEDKDHPTKLQVVDANDQVVYPKDGQDVSTDDPAQFIIDALQNLKISNVSYDIVMKYILPPAEGEIEAKEEEEAPEEKQPAEGNNTANIEQSNDQAEKAATMPVESVMELLQKYKLYENDGNCTCKHCGKKFQAISSDYDTCTACEDAEYLKNYESVGKSLQNKYILTAELHEKYGLTEDEAIKQANRLMEKYKLYEAPEDEEETEEEPKLVPEGEPEVAEEPTLSPEEDAATGEEPTDEPVAGEEPVADEAPEGEAPNAEPVAGLEPEPSTGNSVQPLETPSEAPQTDDPEKIAAFTKKQIMQDYPEEPYTTTALAFADSFVHDPQVYGRIRSLKWDGLYVDSDTFLKQAKIVGSFNKFSPDEAKKLVDKFGDSAKFKVTRDGAPSVFVTVRDTTKQHSLEAVKDLVNAEEVKSTGQAGEIEIKWS